MDINLNEDLKKNYEIKKLIGEGAFGKVYMAENKKTKKLAAIKIFNLLEMKENLKQKYISDEITDEINDELQKYIKGIINEIDNMKKCSYKNDYSVKYYEYFKMKKY